MIETKEQYEALLLKGRANLSVPNTYKIVRTIEALRRFVRASDAVEIGIIDFDLHHEQVKELQDSRAALPGWIGQDG